MSSSRWAKVIWVVLLAFSRNGLAQPRAAVVEERWVLNPSAEASWVVGTNVLEPGQLKLGAISQWHRRVQKGPGRLELSQTRLHLTAAAGLLSFLQLSAQVPFVVSQHLDGSSEVLGAVAPRDGVGMPSAEVRVRLLDEEAGAPVTLLVATRVGFPVGVADGFARDSGLVVAPLIMLSASNGRGVLGAEVRVQLPLSGAAAGSTVPSGDPEVNVGLVFASQREHLNGELSVRSGRSQHWPVDWIEILAGARYHLGLIELFMLGGPGWAQSQEGVGWRVLGGLALGTEPPSRVPALEPAPVDVCREGMTLPPERCPELDFDADGVKNREDACPREAGPASHRGCPEPDTDGDGLVDRWDNCPRVVGPAENHGCPSEQKQLVKITEEKIEIFEVIYFELNKAELLPRSYTLLNQIAQVLEAHPEIRHLRIEGHTDITGSIEWNRTLSQARAESVLDYLGEQGIDEDRLTAVGYGPDRPVADNDDESGRSKNRRVEFVITERGGPASE